MSRFRFSVVALGVIVAAITTIGARAASPSARPAARVSARPAPARPAGAHRQAPPTHADSEWATAAHVAW
jgi:hypothetical protein